MTRVPVDFNTETSEPVGVLKIYEPETPLNDGDTIITYDDEFEVQAQVTYYAATGIWLAVPDWTTKHEFMEQQP